MSISNFTEKMARNTRQGSLDYMATPFMVFSFFDSSDKIFYGRIRNNEFELTANAVFKAIPYYLSGDFEMNSEGITIVKYQIKPNWWALLWTRIIPAAFLITATLCLFNSWMDWEGLLIMGVALIGFATAANLLWMKQIRQFEKKFKELLEIEG